MIPISLKNIQKKKKKILKEWDEYEKEHPEDFI